MAIWPRARIRAPRWCATRRLGAHIVRAPGSASSTNPSRLKYVARSATLNLHRPWVDAAACEGPWACEAGRRSGPRPPLCSQLYPMAARFVLLASGIRWIRFGHALCSSPRSSAVGAPGHKACAAFFPPQGPVRRALWPTPASYPVAAPGRRWACAWGPTRPYCLVLWLWVCHSAGGKTVLAAGPPWLAPGAAGVA